MDKLMLWLSHNWKEILLLVGFATGCLNALIAFLKVMGYPQASAWFGKLEDALTAAYLAFINSKKTPPTAAALLVFCLLAAPAMAQTTITPVNTILDNFVAKQSGEYLFKDKKFKNATLFQIISTNHVDKWGTWGTVLWDGDSIDLGIDYDALNAIDGGEVVFSKDINALLSMAPVSFPFKDKIHLSANFGYCGSKTGGKITGQACGGAAYLRGEVKF